MNGSSIWPYPQWIAHRGAGRRAPENTLAALRLGASLGYRMFECDVQVSADGVPFLLHDDSLERTTSGRGLACARTWSELQALDAGNWHSAAHAGEPIPGLDAVGRFCRERGLLLNLEIKPSPGQQERCGRLIAQAVARDWVGQGTMPLLSSFSSEALRAAREAMPELPRALLLDALPPDSLALAHSLGCVAVIPEDRLWSAAFMRQASALGLRGLSYTVNDPARARQLLEIGLAGLITDSLLP